MPDPNFLWIVVSVADAAAVNPNAAKTLLANVFSTLFIKEKLVFNHVPRSLPKSSPDFR